MKFCSQQGMFLQNGGCEIWLFHRKKMVFGNVFFFMEFLWQIIHRLMVLLYQ